MLKTRLTLRQSSENLIITGQGACPNCSKTKLVPVDGNFRIIRSAVSNSEIVYQLHVMAFSIARLCSPDLRGDDV